MKRQLDVMKLTIWLFILSGCLLFWAVVIAVLLSLLGP